MGKNIGIDLGTTYSCVSYMDDAGNVKIVMNCEYEEVTPSAVFFNPNVREVVVGSTALMESAMFPECLVQRIKNYMGDSLFSSHYVA